MARRGKKNTQQKSTEETQTTDTLVEENVEVTTADVETPKETEVVDEQKKINTPPDEETPATEAAPERPGKLTVIDRVVSLFEVYTDNLKNGKTAEATTALNNMFKTMLKNEDNAAYDKMAELIKENQSVINVATIMGKADILQIKERQRLEIMATLFLNIGRGKKISVNPEQVLTYTGSSHFQQWVIRKLKK